MSNIKKGNFGENLSVKYLIDKGYIIVEKNYRTEFGEIDIIAYDNDILVFIEVKSRTNINYGYPFEAVNIKKQEKILNTSLLYIQENNLENIQLRYDIIEVYIKTKTINHIENSFSY